MFRRLVRGVFVIAPFIATAAFGGQASYWAGRSLTSALRELSSPAARFVFSSRLLPESLTVGDIPSLPAGSDALTTARILLASRGLGLEPVGNSVYAIVRMDPAPPPRAGPTAPGRSDLQEIIVSASRYRFADSTASFAGLEASDLADRPGVGEDPMRALGQLPGMVQTAGSAQSHVRGGEEGETLILLDGFPLRRVFHLSGYQAPFSVIDADLIRSADIYTGGFPARYGNRMSAVFDLRTIDATDEPAHSIGVDAFNASARIAGVNGANVGWLASARVGTLSPLLQTFAPSVGNPRYTDSYLRAGFGEADTLRVTGSFLWARDEFSIADAKRGERGDIEDLLRYIWVRADRNFGPTVSATAWLGQSEIQSHREGELDDPDEAAGSVRDVRHSTLWDLRAQLGWSPSDSHLFEFGGEFTHESAVYRYDAAARYTSATAALFDRSSSFERHTAIAPRRNRSAAFAAYRWRLTDRITAEAGMRAQYVATESESGEWSTDPRLGLRWQVAPATRLHVNWGRYHQIDEVQELKVEDGLSAFPPAQRSEHLIVGVEHRLAAGIGLRLEGYSKQQSQPRERFENLFNRRTLLPEIAPDRIAIAPDFARIRGVELSADYRVPGWHGWAGGGWFRAEDSVAGVLTPRSWDPGWSANAGGAWDRGPWSASATLTVHRGFPSTALIRTPVGSVLGERNGTRLPRYVNLDLRVDYHQSVALGEVRYSAELLNSLNQANDCCTDLASDADGFSLRRLHGLPLLPSVGVRWTW